MLNPGPRKLLLTAHISISVGWLGAVAGFLALSLVGLKSQDDQLVRAAYLGMGVVTWYAIVPLALASLVIGVVQSLWTPWGLIRHYWILVKLGLTVFATVILLVKTRLIDTLSAAAASGGIAATELQQGRLELVVHAGGGLLVLLGITAISVFKPWGKTSFGIPAPRAVSYA